MEQPVRGIGVDIVDVERIDVQLSDKLEKRLFHPEELAPFASHKERRVHVAGRFAAKEAVAKALGTGFGADLGWLDIIIDKEPSGKPTARLSEKAAAHFNNPQIQLSIAHEKSMAIAFAIIF